MRTPYDTKRFRRMNAKRCALVNKMFSVGLTRKEELRLADLERRDDKFDTEYTRRVLIPYWRSIGENGLADHFQRKQEEAKS